MKTKKITGTEDTLTTQQIQDRIEYLLVRMDLKEEPDDLFYAWPGTTNKDDYDPEEIEEFRGLIGFKTEEAFFVFESENDILFVHQDYFGEHASVIAHELYGFEMNDWPFSEIDWEKAADALMQDYKPVELFGTTYYHENF